MLRWPTSLALLFILVLPAFAGKAEKREAERTRLEETLIQLAQRNAWSGVERTYGEMLELGVPLKLSTHMTGVQSALSEGNTLEAMIRLERAVGANPDEKIHEVRDASEEDLATAKQQLEGLRARYGKVELKVAAARLPVLLRPEMPFSTAERDAIKAARAQVAAERSFRGLLPVGKYLLDGEAFEVTPAGAEWQVVEAK